MRPLSHAAAYPTLWTGAQRTERVFTATRVEGPYDRPSEDIELGAPASATLPVDVYTTLRSILCLAGYYLGYSNPPTSLIGPKEHPGLPDVHSADAMLLSSAAGANRHWNPMGMTPIRHYPLGNCLTVPLM